MRGLAQPWLVEQLVLGRRARVRRCYELTSCGLCCLKSSGTKKCHQREKAEGEIACYHWYLFGVDLLEFCLCVG